jgi:hypothetical protein
MKRLTGGEPVQGGTYVDLKTGQLVSFGKSDQAVLPGTPSDTYARLPIGLVFVLGPLAGLAYVIFLPLAGIGSLVILTGSKIRTWSATLAPKPVK